MLGRQRLPHKHECPHRDGEGIRVWCAYFLRPGAFAPALNPSPPALGAGGAAAGAGASAGADASAGASAAGSAFTGSAAGSAFTGSASGAGASAAGAGAAAGAAFRAPGCKQQHYVCIL